MNHDPIDFKIYLHKEEENEETYLCSKILGTPVFPKKFFLNKNGKRILNDEDYFILKPKVLFAKDLEEAPLEVWKDYCLLR